MKCCKSVYLNWSLTDVALGEKYQFPYVICLGITLIFYYAIRRDLKVIVKRLKFVKRFNQVFREYQNNQEYRRRSLINLRGCVLDNSILRLILFMDLQ